MRMCIVNFSWNIIKVNNSFEIVHRMSFSLLNGHVRLAVPKKYWLNSLICNSYRYWISSCSLLSNAMQPDDIANVHKYIHFSLNDAFKVSSNCKLGHTSIWRSCRRLRWKVSAIDVEIEFSRLGKRRSFDRNSGPSSSRDSWRGNSHAVIRRGNSHAVIITR